MSEKYTVLKKFCNNERQPNMKVSPGEGRPGTCHIGAWYPGEEYTGVNGKIDPKECARLAKEGLIKKGKARLELTIDDLGEGEGLKVGEEIVTGKEGSEESEDDGIINRDEDESEEDHDDSHADGEEDPEAHEVKEEAKPKRSRGKK